MLLAVAILTLTQPWQSLPQYVEPSFAYRYARDQGLQGRLLWIDGTANISLVADRRRLATFMAKAKAVGFNTVVYDIKPIVGRTLYPSRFASPLLAWRGESFPPGYDPLAEVLAAGHKSGLKVCVSMNAFSEGHLYAKRAVESPNSPFGAPGPGYRWPERQSVVLRHSPVIKCPSGKLLTVGQGPTFALQYVTGKTDAAHVDLLVDGSVATADSQPDKVSAHLTGSGDDLREVIAGRLSVTYDFVRSADSQNQIPLMMNPFDHLVREHIWTMVDEVAQKYPIDGLLFDDRLRFTGLDGDFSEETRKGFEAQVGEVKWPDDVYSVVYRPDLSSYIVPGKFFDQWLTFRARAISSFVEKARDVLKHVRPSAAFGVYAGSSYGHYAKNGSNYGSVHVRAGFSFLTPEYRATGFAGSLDLLVSGCYYRVPTIAEARANGLSEGSTVEAAALVSHASTYDATCTYAGVMLQDYDGRTDELELALKAAAGNSEGVMVFDASHKIDQFWPVFARVFAKPARAPHTVPGFLERVRRARRSADRRGTTVWNYPILDGFADAGF